MSRLVQPSFVTPIHIHPRPLPIPYSVSVSTSHRCPSFPTPNPRNHNKVNSRTLITTARLFQSQQPDPPPEIKHLDQLYIQYLQQTDSSSSSPNDSQIDDYSLTPEEEELLFLKFPQLRQLSIEMDQLMAQPDYDPQDPNVWSWAYRYLSPPPPNRLLQLLSLSSIALASFFLYRLSQRYTLSKIVSTIVFLESSFLIPLTYIFPFLLTFYLVLFKRPRQIIYDAATRIMLMFSASSLALIPVTAICATGNVILAMISGIFVRIAMLATTLWYWHDLSYEILIPSTFIDPLICHWRKLTTIFVIVFGSVIRLLAIYQQYHHLPFAHIMSSNAQNIRLALGKSFPIACSLCNDPRGLFFLASILMIMAFVYMTYLFFFGVNLGRINVHRKCNPYLFSNLMIHFNVFMPNVHPDERTFRSSAPDPSTSYMPSSIMLLKHEDGISDIDSSLLSTENAMPIFSYLEGEQEILEKEGAKEWLKPHDQLIPITDSPNQEHQRRLNALKLWAQPLSEEDAKLTFEEYFQTLQENEYAYDPDQQSWVFNNLEKNEQETSSSTSNENDQNNTTSTSTTQNKTNKNDYDDDGTNTSPFPEVPVDDATIAEFATSPEFRPYIKRYIEQLKKEGNGENDDFLDSVYV